jgi:GST-like protein
MPGVIVATGAGVEQRCVEEWSVKESSRDGCTVAGQRAREPAVIELYSLPTPNGRKVHLMLEECGLPYQAHRIDITRGDQFRPDFLRLNPNGRIPVIVDTDGPGGTPFTVFESGAILWYLGEKTGCCLPSAPRERAEVLQWLMFQMGGVGPMFGQANHFRRYAPERVPYGIARYTTEAQRLLKVLDERLAATPWLAAGAYTIADIATYPWVVDSDVRGESPGTWPHLADWVARIAARPATPRAWELLATDWPGFQLDERARTILYGATQLDRAPPGGGGTAA